MSLVLTRTWASGRSGDEAASTAATHEAALLRMVDELEAGMPALRVRLAERTDRPEPG
jgi:hypothetical protein